MRNALLGLTALTALTAFAVSNANATLKFSANINGTIFSCADQQVACDTDATVGILSIANQTIAGVSVLGSAQTQTIGPVNSLNTSSFQITNTLAIPVSYQLSISGTDFLGPVSAFNASGSGTFQSAIGSTTTQTFYGDAANTQGADFPLDLPGTQLASFTKVAGTVTDSFSQNFSGPFASPGLHSLSLGTVGTLTAGGSLVGRSQAILTVQNVPEPMSLSLLGVGLLGIGIVTKRRSRNAA